MKLFVPSMVAGAVALAGVFLASDAEACGGCFHIQQSETGQVTGHRMIFSISNEGTTLWDQISYDGTDPEGFAWVLPIQGQVDIGLSSDALFAQLEQMSNVQVISPDINCGPQTCPDDGGGGFNGTITTTFTTSSPGGVTVIAEETVGPFETVQLQSSDPQALEAWLEGHGYAIPDDILPIIAAYVSEGFDFLAMRLAPGENVSSMRPVRVTAPGAGLGLPLRMVAAGTGAMTPITLWIAGEGRYQPANFPTFEIKPEDVVWNWDTQSSNYTALKQAGFASTNGAGWLVEFARDIYPDEIGYALENTAEYDPEASGYGSTAEEAVPAVTEDLYALYGTLDPNSMWITRVHGQLTKDALSTDLQVGAAASQTEIYPEIYTTKTTGTAPSCPPPPDCDGDGGNGSGANGAGASGQNGSGVGLWSPNGSGGGDGDNEASAGGSGGCAIGGREPAFGALLAALGLAAARRRRRASATERRSS